jgi:hypothetical protein
MHRVTENVSNINVMWYAQDTQIYVCLHGYCTTITNILWIYLCAYVWFGWIFVVYIYILYRQKSRELQHDISNCTLHTCIVKFTFFKGAWFCGWIGFSMISMTGFGGFLA